MPGFDHSILTDVGWDALADAMSNKKLAFVHMEAGDGTITGGDAQMQGMTSLVHKVMDIPITSFSDDGKGQITLIGTLTSKNNLSGAGFYFKELGVKSTIDAGAELLYAMANNITPDYIPASTDSSTVIETVQMVVKIDRTVTPVVNIVAGGDVTAQNIGVDTVGPGWFRDKIGQVLNFKRLVSSNSIKANDLGDTVSLDVILQALIPLGIVWEFAGSAIPSNWMLCDGSLLSRINYAGLFAAIGVRYGGGDGVNTFALPDFRGRSSIGAGAGTGLTSRVLGNSGGWETVALSVAQMPVHNHSASQPPHTHYVYDPTHAHAVWDPTHAHSVSDPMHNHAYIYFNYTSSGVGNQGSEFGNNFQGWTGNAGANIGIYGAGTGIGIYAAYTGITLASAGNEAVTVGNTGGGQVHPNMHPYLTINKIIKVL